MPLVLELKPAKLVRFQLITIAVILKAVAGRAIKLTGRSTPVIDGHLVSALCPDDELLFSVIVRDDVGTG